MKSNAVAAIIFLILASCVSKTSREVASVQVPSLVDFGKSLSEYTGFVRSSSFTPSNCGPVYSAIASKVESLDFNLYSNEELQKEAANLISALWQMRLQLHARLSEVSPQCQLQVRELFHRMHDQDDYLGEFAYKAQALDPSKLEFQKQAIPIYDRKAYAPYSVRPDVDDEKFQFYSGDLMLARGVSFFSAIISQISDNKSQFSHVVFVSQEPMTKKLNTIESYIGVGVDKYQMDFALKNENARLLVLRPKDRVLGEKAAGFAMESAKARVPYDYFMNFKDYSKMSCVEVARSAYDKASNGAVLTPAQPANLKMNSKDFLDKLNLKNGSLITPDDLEVDPRFELVLDWRDYRLLRDSRHKDAILSEMVRWMDEMGYKFHDTPKSFIAKNIILPTRTTRLWPLVKKLTGSPDLDPALPKKTLGVMLVLNQVGQSLLERLDKQDLAYIAKFKRPMTNGQLRAAVNQLRELDLKEYKESNPSFLHFALRPDGIYPRRPPTHGEHR
ncbi:hypothetical protein [Bdellovibrio svalbardensis]|uniref:Uncharacterized protein n=1 Tax=Bdellovibrio svalbardensis TaxID=2972972 RepID=A0ABT6DIH5_9BACT|nr:hypothetical protein [Bdellovibrio svalbardensis]MDG0816653.1 hypothetical protein [Bdellovibrio svalbardensis]